LLLPKIEECLRSKTNIQHSKFQIISQGDIVANSLVDYLRRHPDIAHRAKTPILDTIPTIRYLTTESAQKFEESASLFLAEPIRAQHIEL
jgi:glutamate racemase